MNEIRSATMLSLFIVLIVCSTAPINALGQSYILLSKNADFSTEDRSFDREDVLHVKVVAPGIDYSDLDDNEFRLKPDEGDNDIEHPLTNHLNGTYTTYVDLSTIDHREDDWEVRVELKDENDGEFEARIDIKVHGNTNDGGNDFDDDEVELTGRIEALDENGITVEGVHFAINESTQVLNDDNQPISLSDLFVGQIVEVRGDRLSDNSLLATKIKVEDDFEDGDDEVEFTGVIGALSTSMIEVSGVQFHVNEHTIVLNDDNQEISLADLFVGQVVEIRGDRQGDGSLLATHIKIEDDVVGDDEVEFKGVIESLSDSSIVVNGVMFTVNSNTAVLDNNNNPIDFTSLVSGQLVEIKGVRQGDGSLLAVRIKLEDRDDDEVELTGEIEQINGSSLVVAGLTFLVDDRTVVLNDDNQPIPFSDLVVGMFVEIRADVQADGSLLASDIKIEDRLEDEVEVRGIADSVSDSALVVLGREFVVLPSTAVRDDNDQPIDFTALSAGDIVEVKATILPGGLLIAVEIELEDDDPFRVRVQGPVDAIGPDTLNVSGIYLMLSGSTSVTDTNGDPASINDVAAGQSVDVDAQGQQNGIPVVSHIRIKKVAQITGSISSVENSSFNLAGKTIQVDNSTLILGAKNETLALAALSSGQLARVRTEISGAAYVATTIELLKSTVFSVDIENGTELPGQFNLGQNYPNPFNPTTTISFEILQAGTSNVSLTVYNVLGQAVRTLLSQELTDGNYQVEWNGRNDNGQQLASGLYLYQLRVNDLIQSKTMVLMK